MRQQGGNTSESPPQAIIKPEVIQNEMTRLRYGH